MYLVSNLVLMGSRRQNSNNIMNQTQEFIAGIFRIFAELNGQFCPYFLHNTIGISCVDSPNRMPEPAANIIAFIMCITHSYL